MKRMQENDRYNSMRKTIEKDGEKDETKSKEIERERTWMQ